jgi:hypothetical protein
VGVSREKSTSEERERLPPPGMFLAKSVELFEKNGVTISVSAKKRKRVWKSLKRQEIERA